MSVLRSLVASTFLLMALSGSAQTLRFSGPVQAGQAYRRPIGLGLMLEVTTQGIAVRPLMSAASDNFAACATPPAHGPNPIDIQGWHFDPARSAGAPGVRRTFQFALTAKSDKMECALVDAHFEPDAVPGYRAPRLGSGRLTLSEVKLNGSGDEVASFRFAAVIKLPPRR